MQGYQPLTDVADLLHEFAKKEETKNWTRKKKKEGEKPDFQNLGPKGELLGRREKKGSEQS